MIVVHDDNAPKQIFERVRTGVRPAETFRFIDDERNDVICIDVRHIHIELIPTDARGQSCFRRRHLKQLTEMNEKIIADLVTVRVVDSFKAVEVDDDKRRTR